MFEKMYLDSISKIKPDRELIESTKKMMINELENKKNIKNISFYKYASIAACVVVVISVLTLYPRNIIKDLSTGNISTPTDNFIAEDKVYFEGATMNKDNSVKFPNSNSFDSFAGASGDIGALADSSVSIKKSNPFLDGIKEIIQWFYELLF